ncbi:Nitric oxide synthase-interacting protein-like protein [Botrytis cinerea]
MSHSKRNTSRAVFTSHERELAKSAWTSTQKKEIKRLEKNKEKDDQDKNEDRMREEDEARERAVEEFEKVQMGLEGKTGGKGGKIVGRGGGKILVEQEVNSEGGKRGEKRKFELDEDELLRIAQDERSKARRAIDDEKASKTTLPSFWVPSVTPSSNTNTTLHNIIKKAKQSPVCPASQQDKPHNYSLHTLITVAFTEETDTVTKKPQRICPSCKKQLTNTSKARVHDPHAEAGTDQNAVACYVCEADLTERNDVKEKGKKADKEKIKPGLVEIKSEGTGFASAGGNKVVKEDVAFQC